MSIESVAVLDDTLPDREVLVWNLEEVGYRTMVIEDATSINGVIQQIRDHAQALVCDHQLRWGAAAQFDGAELVARCFEQRIPAVLVTSWVADIDTSIRAYRRNITGLIPRDQLDGPRLKLELEASESELSDRPPPQRVPRRALVRIGRVRRVEGLVDVLIPQWNPYRYVTLPISLLKMENLGLSLDDLEGQRLLAKVNTGAGTAADLYFEQFEGAGDVPEESELA